MMKVGCWWLWRQEEMGQEEVVEEEEEEEEECCMRIVLPKVMGWERQVLLTSRRISPIMKVESCSSCIDMVVRFFLVSFHSHH